MKERRKILFADLLQAKEECERLAAAGYTRVGNWSLGQICHHLRVAQDASVEGYPTWMLISLPLRPVLRWFMLDKLLRGDSPAGIRTAGIFVPPESSDEKVELEKFAASIERFRNHSGSLHSHPGFGRFTHEEFERFHAAHASHHLGFLLPAESTQ